MKEFNLAGRQGNPYCDVLAVLNQCDCPYLVIGGVAVVLHGSSRFTPDINLLLDLDHPNIKNIIDACNFLGMKSQTSDGLECLLDPKIRKKLVQDGHVHFKISSYEYPGFSADFLLPTVEDFTGLFHRRTELLVFNQKLPLISMLDLIAMKLELNRPQDQLDVSQLGVVQIIQQCKAAKMAVDQIAKSLPAGYDRPMLETMVSFQELNPTQKLEWLLEMLAAIGGFCLIK